MKLRTLPLGLASALLMATAAHASPPPAQDNQPLRPVSKCLDVANINEWHVIDDTTLTARNGPRRYLVKTTHRCPRLGKHGGGLFFHASNGKMGAWRICGDLGETVSSRYQPPCAIRSVKLIDKQQFDALNRHAERNGNGTGTGQPTLPSKQH